MPRCGCAKGQDALTCTCAVESGDPRITVTGTGAPGISPYRISLTDPGPGVEVTDTDTVDMTMTGQDPAVISSDVKLSGDEGNALVQGSDGGLFVADGTAVIPPVVNFAYQTAPQIIPDQTPVPLTWDAVDPAYSITGTQITAEQTGVHVVSLAVEFEGTFAADRVSCWLAVAGDPYNRITATWRNAFEPATVQPMVAGCEPVYLTQGQTLEAVVYQYSGAERSTRVNDRATRLKITVIG